MGVAMGGATRYCDFALVNHLHAAFIAYTKLKDRLILEYFAFICMFSCTVIFY